MSHAGLSYANDLDAQLSDVQWKIVYANALDAKLSDVECETILCE